MFLGVCAVAAPGFTWRVGGLFETGRVDLSPLFILLPWLLLILMPALAMRAWAEERDRGTLEVLLASPIALWAATLGKFLAAWAIAALALTLTTPLWIAMTYLGDPDHVAIATAYVGALLLAGGYLALGQLVSATTSNQVVAFVLGVTACFLITVSGLPAVLDALSDQLPGAAAEAFGELSALARFESLRRGVVSLSDLIYFLSLIGAALTGAAALIDARRGGGR